MDIALDPELTSLLTRNYPISPFTPVSRLATKGQREALLLETALGRFVLKITDPRRDEKTVQSDTGILSYLGRHDFPAPRLLFTKNGGMYLPYRDSFIHLYAYLEGEPPMPGMQFFERAGRILARLHCLPAEEYGRESGYTPEGIAGEVRGYLRQALQSDQKSTAEVLLDHLDRLPSFAGLPRGLIHTDPYLVNWLRNPAGDLALIDWDDAGVGVPLLDVGYAVAHLTTYPRHEAQRWGVPFVSQGGFTSRADWAHEFLRGYEAVRPLAPAERAMLLPAAQLSVLAYVWDWDTQRLFPGGIERVRIVEGYGL
jgi:Ser/Thr protein kinase RdoA (MazF antagonist)